MRAIHLRTVGGFLGDAALYRLVPPFAGLEYVIVSSATNPQFATSRMVVCIDTAIFGADSEGNSSGECVAQMPLTASHRQALLAIGYTLESVAESMNGDYETKSEILGDGEIRLIARDHDPAFDEMHRSMARELIMRRPKNRRVP